MSIKRLEIQFNRISEKPKYKSLFVGNIIFFAMFINAFKSLMSAFYFNL